MVGGGENMLDRQRKEIQRGGMREKMDWIHTDRKDNTGLKQKVAF